jgi:hypothetical protein
MSFTVDVRRHIPPDFFFRETNDAHNPFRQPAFAMILHRDSSVVLVVLS